MVKFVVCLSNTGYEASLDVRRLYVHLPDDDAKRVGLVRVIDESGEDYLYPRDMFEEVSVSDAGAEALKRAS